MKRSGEAEADEAAPGARVRRPSAGTVTAGGPYLSFVLGSRNDDYAGSMLHRLQITLDLFLAQLEEHRLDTEIVLVEWNPPADRPPLAEALDFPPASRHVTVRLVTAPPEIHRRYRDWEAKPIHIGVVYNVGIRRARGRFVAHRASDVAYSNALVRFLAGRTLSEEHVYRCDRYDVGAATLDAWRLQGPAALEGLDEGIAGHHRRLEVSGDLGIPDLHTNASGDFTLMSRGWWETIRGRFESPSVLIADLDSLVLHAACAAGARERELPGDCRLYKVVHPSQFARSVQERWTPLARALDEFARTRLGTRWRNRLRSLFNYPLRTFQSREEIVLDSFEKNFLARAQRWARGKGPFHLNGEDWGLAKEDLPDRRLCRAEWDL